MRAHLRLDCDTGMEGSRPTAGGGDSSACGTCFVGLCYQKERRSIAIVVEWCPKTLRAWLNAIQPSKETRIHVRTEHHSLTLCDASSFNDDTWCGVFHASSFNNDSVTVAR